MTPLAYRKSYPLPGGFAVAFSLNAGRLECEWSPALPRGKRAKMLLPHYRAARDRFLASLDIPVAVVEL